MKLLGALSPAKNSTVSLDLLNLYIVNQISSKKEKPEIVRKPVHVNMNRDIKMPARKRDLELPMSPNCVPSKLCLDDTENSVHYQELGSKKEFGSVQSSQVMDFHSAFKPQFNKTGNCRFPPPSFSEELSSNNHILKQNFAPGIAPIAYEKNPNEQFTNVNYSASLPSTLNGCQGALSSSYKRAQFGTLFESLNSPGNENFLTERSAIIMSEDHGHLNERGETDLITEKQTMQPFWGENNKEVLNSIEDVNQPNSHILSENCDSFISQNMINILNLDQQGIKENIDKYDCDSVGNICVFTSSSKKDSTDRCVKSIFTIPKLTSSNSAFNKRSYPEKSQANKNYQKEYNNNERKNINASFKKHCYPASSEKTGKFENNYQKKIPQEKIQENIMNKTSLGELHFQQPWETGYGEILMEDRGTSSLKARPASPEKIYLDSSQSSQSTSYSPKQTDSCFSSSSEMPSEEEDQVLEQSEESDGRFFKTKETSNNMYLKRMSKLLDDKIIKNNANIYKQNENSHKFSVKNNTDQFPQSQCNSPYLLQDKIGNNCTLQDAKCDAWVQTEVEHEMNLKLDVAIQCDILSKCNCRSSVSSFCSTESCSENIKSDTTGGQEVLKNN
ncbi:PREDICTED: uncharacterized protein C12orf40 homolog [Elephantulus edwardii]|uniref:uncharacterized protein C12orf40 homolog n=1 Tax=Elephantulus edwardii TaxID=28737 RepID=UPI0003F0A113|nr:PREDICTED: uncharacterized protein C12orf40 homolog [Elephantulus edwardii]